MIQKIKKLKKTLPLLIILLLGLSMRTFGLNWDQGAFLHPDERFLVMVSQSLEVPKPSLSYLDPSVSSFNPVNTGHKFYVYGSLPVVVHKLLENVVLANPGFLEATLLGRIMSAIIDSLVIILVFKIVELFEKPLKLSSKTKLWAALFYALMVFPIQISHFFTVDPFLNFFSLLGVYFALKVFLGSKKLNQIVLSGLAFSVAMAAKVSAVYPMALAIFLIFWASWFGKKSSKKNKLIFLIKSLSLFFLTIYLGLRFFNPGYFASLNILDPSISPIFVENIKMLNAWSHPDTWFPPAIQWLNKPWWFAGKNLILYGLGLPVFLFVLAGIHEFIKKSKKSGLWLILVWIVVFSFWQSIQFTKTMRYFLVIYPWLSILGAMGVEHIKNKLSRQTKLRKNEFFINVILIVVMLIWPLAFLNIYTQNHSRVQASAWLEKNLSENTVLLSEYWDDALPVTKNFKRNKVFKQIELHVFDQDSPEKWLKMEQQLSEGEYYILSSNRAWDSIGNNPDRYPKMSEFYFGLLNNHLSYKLEKKFVVYPSLRWLGISIDFNDSGAEEAFTVYDHPEVMIFKKN